MRVLLRSSYIKCHISSLIYTFFFLAVSPCTARTHSLTQSITHSLTHTEGKVNCAAPSSGWFGDITIRDSLESVRVREGEKYVHLPSVRSKANGTQEEKNTVIEGKLNTRISRVQMVIFYLMRVNGGRKTLHKESKNEERGRDGRLVNWIEYFQRFPLTFAIAMYLIYN